MRGKVYWQKQTPPKQQDHPRLCGEKSMKLTVAKRYLGSPPPMRGKD